MKWLIGCISSTSGPGIESDRKIIPNSIAAMTSMHFDHFAHRAPLPGARAATSE